MEGTDGVSRFIESGLSHGCFYSRVAAVITHEQLTQTLEIFDVAKTAFVLSI